MDVSGPWVLWRSLAPGLYGGVWTLGFGADRDLAARVHKGYDLAACALTPMCARTPAVAWPWWGRLEGVHGARRHREGGPTAVPCGPGGQVHASDHRFFGQVSPCWGFRALRASGCVRKVTDSAAGEDVLNAYALACVRPYASFWSPSFGAGRDSTAQAITYTGFGLVAVLLIRCASEQAHRRKRCPMLLYALVCWTFFKRIS